MISNTDCRVETPLRTTNSSRMDEDAMYISIKQPPLPSRPPSRRPPLVDTTKNANNCQISTPVRNSSIQPSSSPRLPHHQSLMPNGNLQMPNRSSPATSSPENKRVSAVANGSQRDTNRDSQISTTSTNASNTTKKRKTHVGPWQLGKTMGKGATGRVRKARHQLTGQCAAVKIVSKQSALEWQSKSIAQMDRLLATASAGKIGGRKRLPSGIEREVVIMKLIEHPNIISLYDVWENRGEL